MAKVATATITRLEAGGTLKPRTVEAIQHALEKAGVEFIDGDKPGVRVKYEKTCRASCAHVKQ